MEELRQITEKFLSGIQMIISAQPAVISAVITEENQPAGKIKQSIHLSLRNVRLVFLMGEKLNPNFSMAAGQTAASRCECDQNVPAKVKLQ